MMHRLLEILGKAVGVVAVVAMAMEREHAIAAFPLAVEAGDDAEAGRAVARAAIADETLRKLGVTPLQ